MSLPKIQPKMNEISIEILDQIPAPTVQAIRPVKKIIPQEKQIVQQEEKKSEDEAPDTKFLSAQNQKVLKQTVAKNNGQFKNSKKSSTSPKNWSLAPKMNATNAFAEEALKKELNKKTNSESSAEKSAEVADSSQTDDHLKQVDQGLETLLNAREFKYYTYYNRIRRQLSQHWEPKVRTKLSQLFKQGRTIAAATDRITKLVVVLDRTGNLVKVQVLKESGVIDLDEAATEAFQSAAPFPNPPTGIVEKDGTVKIRWDFVLES